MPQTEEPDDAITAARLRAVFDLALDAVLLADDDGRYIDANPAACLLLGYSRDELLTLRVADVAWDGSSDEVDAQFAGFLADGAAGGTFALRHRSGRRIETEYRAVANILPGLHVSIVRDVSGRNADVRALAASEARFRSLAETASDMVAVVRVDDGPTFEVEYVNPAGRRLLPAIVGRSCPALRTCHEHDVAELHRALATVAAEPARARIQCAPDGEDPRWLEIVATVLPGTGESRVVQLVGRDVTHQERTRAALEAALRQEREAAHAVDVLTATKQRILQNISHELRTPVTVIVGLAELLTRPEVRSGTDLAELHTHIVKHGHRIERLLDDLLDVNVDDAGSALMLEERDLSELVRAGVDRADLDGRRVTVDLEPVTASIDIAKFSRIIDSLLDNVVRHTPSSTHVLVRLRATGDGARLTVADDGPGIPAEDRVSLFEPFHQGELATRAAQPGTGIGLALVRALAAAHGGRAWLEPTQVGTTIHVAVPEVSPGRHL